MDSKSHSGKRIYADLQDHSLPGGGTVPPGIFVTLKKPALVIVDDDKKVIELFELTCCGDTDTLIKGAQNRKYDRYQHTFDGINGDQDNPYKCKLSCFEVCALGNIPSHARQTIRYLVGKKASRATLLTLAKLSISTSYYIFNRRRIKEWGSPPPFERRLANSGKKA